MAAAESHPGSLPPPPLSSSSDPPPETQEEENRSPDEKKGEEEASSLSSLAAAAALVVAEAEAPLRWAPPRERWALRKLPQNKSMGKKQLEQLLKSAFETSPALREELRGEVVSLSSSKKKNKGGKKLEEKERRRCLAACLRSAALLAAGDCEQALRDARAAVARAPLSSSSGPPPFLDTAASALLASSLEASGDRSSEALLEWLRCLSRSSSGNPGVTERRAEGAAAVERLRRRVPPSHAAATATASGNGDGDFAAAARSLSSLLSREEQDSLPEVMRPRPRYYHYFKWTTKRIKAANGGTLPAPEVLRLLLASPAGDLDDLLSHPTAAAAAVARLTAAFERGGAGALEAAGGVPRLTWEEMREVQAWREGREVEAGEEQQALEGAGEGRRQQQLPWPEGEAASPSSALSAASRNDDSRSDEPELDLDALDF